MRGRSRFALGLLLTIALVVGLPAAAQDGRALWAKTYGGTASDNGSLVKDNGDGTYFISGTTRSTSATGADLLLMKVDSSGAILWQKTYGSTGDDYGSISPTSDGGFAAIFAVSQTASAPLTLLKLDGNGDIAWQKTYGTPSESYTSGQVLQGGGFLLAGSTFNFFPPSGTVRLMKLDASGNITWQKKYSSPTLLLQSIMAFPLDGGGYLANCNGMDMTAGTVTNLLLKLDGSGNITAQKAFSVPAGQVYGTIAPVSDGGILYVGSFNPDPEGDGKTDILLAKLNASGDIAWQKTYGGALDESGYVLPISGGYILSGSTRSYGGGETNSRALLAKLDANGNVLWGKTYGGTQDDFLSAMADTTGGYLLQGGTLSFATGGTTTEDFWAVKVNDSGDIQWQRAYGGSNEDDGYLERTSDGMLLTGDTKSVGSGDYDIWIWKLDSQGQLGTTCPLLHNTTATAATITLGAGTGTLVAGSSDVEDSVTSYTSGTGSMNKYAPSLASKDACSGAQSLTASASANPTSGAAPLTVNFTGSATGGTPGYTFSWNFGDAQTSTQQNPSHTYAAPGNYTVTLTVTDATQATASDNHITITVTGGACTVDCSATVPPGGTAGVPVQFASTYSANGCTGAPVFAWTFGDQTAPSTQQNPTHTYASAGTYLWSFTVTVDGQVCTRGGTITITGGGVCTVTCTATVPTTGIVGSPIAFASTATASNCAGQVTALWAFGDDSMPSMEQNPSHTYAAEGTYEWTFMASAGIAAPCIKSGTITISGANPCASDTSFPDWKAEYFNNSFFEDVVLTKNETGAFIDHDWGSNSPYPGCVNDVHWSVIWTRNISVPAPGYFKFTMGSDDGSELFVDGSADLFSGDMNHEQGFIQNDIFYYLSAGTHNLHMNYWDFEGVAQALLQYTPEEPPCTYTLTASGTPTSGAAPLTVNFAAEASQNSCTGVPRYRWIFDAGDIVEGETQTRTYSSPGTYTWKLVVTVDTVVTYRTGTITVAGGGKPGDCNGDGTVSIGEVQKAINMFLGIAPVECGVDCNGDGSVSIGEVQKVINAFLGVSSSC